MELQELKEEIDEMRPEEHEVTESLALLMAKVGHMAEGGMVLDEAPDVDAEKEAAQRRDMLAGVIIACMEYASEHDVDVEQAVSDVLEEMKKQLEKRREVMEAVEEGDAEALADALGADANEVPTGMLDDEDDGPRGFQ